MLESQNDLKSVPSVFCTDLCSVIICISNVWYSSPVKSSMLGKSLVVFWEGQRLARTLARKGLVRRQAEERGGGQVRRPARVCQASGNTAR